ncbi:MAG: type III-B CRISPR module RAMP protein Cmr4 [Ardenticatenia bacterium]|nr:type III-B CRISPR module RAMP protein Cmr4 [Ardenticatenia bacterium]
MTHNPQTYRYFLLTLDPVHIGTGGTRLGRVDLSIVREPGTRLPKIPGSSLHGVIRAYAAHRYGKPQCAGQGEAHCGRPACPICYTFGYARDRDRGHAGVVAIGDARILLFPVYSMVGPVWVSTVNILQEAGFQVRQDGNNVSGEGPFATFEQKQPLNLGWLMIDPPAQVTITDPSQASTQQDNAWESLPDPIRNRVVLVSDKLFSQIVNSNLEVRTSVSINPETGAAEEGALFTYEAIPRATVLWMDVVVSDYRDEFPTQARLEDWENTLMAENDEAKKALLVKWGLMKKDQNLQNDKITKAREWLQKEQAKENGQNIWRWQKQQMQGVEQSPKGIVEAGLAWAAYLGVGGMGTRGFGRIRQVARCEVTDCGAVEKCKPENAHGDTESTGN